MKFFDFSFRSKKEVTVSACVQWEVRWTSRHSEFSNGTREEVRVFTDESQALEFSCALKDAFRLIRHTSQTLVSLTKVDS